MACKPITEKKLIEKIKQKYIEHNQKRDLIIFLLAINTGTKLTELLKLKVCDVKNKNKLVIKDSLKNLKKELPLNNEIKGLIKEYTKDRNLNEPLFISKAGKSIDRVQVFRNFKEICVELGIENDYSILSWRKTFGYHYYKKYGDLAILEWLFSQTSVVETLKFIGINENLNSHFKLDFSL